MTAAPALVRHEFRLLGPLELWRDGSPVKLGGERQRALLALLLLHANEVVTTDVLVDELFGSEPSDGAVNAVQAGISRLRRVLAAEGDGSESVLATETHGYMLRVLPDELDVARFERLVAEGRRAALAGDPTTASTSLREALALWRGPALADLQTLDFAAAEIRRLEELRLAALMDRVDADLAAGGGAELVPELERLVVTNPTLERARGQLMLALYRSGRQADALAVYRATRELLRDELGLEPSRALQQLEQAILRQDESLDLAQDDAVTGAPAADEIVVCPFKGLAFFDVGDREYFCGRERLVAEVVSRIVGSTFVGIVGPSGAGKSSLLRAGVASSLRAGVLPGSEHWTVAVVRPGADPRASLEHALGDRTVADALAGLEPGGRLVIAVDQLEELFVATQDEGDRDAFLATLADAADDQGRRCLVLVALRADFYGRCAAYPRFADLLSGQHVLVGSMDRAELRRAIELPAARAGLQPESALVDAIVADVTGQPGALPLLSTALLELWRGREGRLLRHDAYRASGGVHGAVARLAESAYDSLSEPEQAVARVLLLRLATGEGDAVVRRRVALTDLDVGLAGDETTARVLAVFTDARLVTVSDGDVEVSHEALLREWPRLRNWLDEDRAGRRLHEHLGSSARDWDERGHDHDDLYRGARLATALDWAATHPQELSVLEREFVDASRDDSERDLRAQRRRNRRLRLLLACVGALLALAVAAGALAVAQRRDARDQARAALARQLGAEAIVEPRIDRAMLLAREAVDLDPSAETHGTLLATLLRSPAALATFPYPIDRRPLDLAVSPDGRRLVVEDNHSEMRFLDTRTRREVRQPLQDVAVGIEPSYSRDGGLLLVPTFPDGVPHLSLLDGRTFRLVRQLRLDRRFLSQPTGPVQPTGLSPDGSTAFLAYDIARPDFSEGAGYLDVWDVRSGRLRTIPVGSDDVIGGGFVAGGRRIVTVTTDEIATWDASTLRPLARTPISASGLATVSPDGRTVAFGTPAGDLSFVDATTGRVTSAPTAHSAAIERVAFSPDGRRLVTTGDDAKVVLWDVATHRPLETLLGHGGRITSAAFTADGKTLYSASLDGALFQWDLGRSRRFGRPFRTGPEPGFLPDDVPLTPPLALAPDGSRFAVRVGRSGVGVYSTRTLGRMRLLRFPSIVTAASWAPTGVVAIGTRDGAVRLWTPDHRSPVRVLRGLHGPVQAIAWGRDGLIAATSLRHTPGNTPPAGELALWARGSSGPPRRVLRFDRPGTALAFSPSAGLLAVGLGDGRVLLVDPRSGRVGRTIRPVGDPNVALAFAPGGTLGTGSWAGIVQQWDTSTGRQLGHPVLTHAAPVASLSFAPEGATFATAGGSDGLAKLWGARSLQQFGSTFPGAPGHWGNAAYTADGRQLVVVYDDGSGYIWPASVRAWLSHACAVAGRNLTREEWARFVTGRPYARVCP